MAIEPRERLILALDVPSADEAKRLLDRVRDAVACVKIGLELFTAAGPDIVRWALAQRKRVFLDLKLLDIGETVKRATAAAAEPGVTFLTLHDAGRCHCRRRRLPRRRAAHSRCRRPRGGRPGHSGRNRSRPDAPRISCGAPAVFARMRLSS